MNKLIKNSLGYDSNLFLYQDKTMFNYSIDTILLANFVAIKKSTKRILDVGTNNGALAIFLAERLASLKIDAIEIIPQAVAIARKNVAINNKQSQIKVIESDFNIFVTQKARLNDQKYEAIVCNPPFYKVECSKKSADASLKYIATHETKLTLEQLIRGAAQIIKQKGYLTLVLPPERLVDAFADMRKNKFEPKRVQMIHSRTNAKASLVLVEARFQAGWGVHFLKNIYLHYDDLTNHDYRDEVKALYKPLKVKGDF